jgi:predicted nucleic acid-binding protein
VSDSPELNRPAIIVTDASVLINFLRIDRIDLIAGHSHAFLATDHVANEVSDRYPDQQRRFASALDSGTLTLIPVAAAEELRLFASLSATGRLGAGECSAIAVAVQRGYSLAIDDRVANRLARRFAPSLHILTTQDLVVSMIRQDLLDVDEADRIKHEWSTRHRFTLKLDSFQSLLP